MEKNSGFQILKKEIKASLSFDLVHLEVDAQRASADAIAFLKSLLVVYNDWRETGKAGTYRIYDISKAADLKRCIECGMTARQISNLYQITENYQFPFFLFGKNHPTVPLLNWEEVRVRLLNYLDGMIESVIKRPYAHLSYMWLYNKYIVEPREKE